MTVEPDMEPGSGGDSTPMRAKMTPTTKQAAHLIGIALATLLALAAVVSAVLNPTDLNGRPLSRETAAAVEGRL